MDRKAIKLPADKPQKAEETHSTTKATPSATLRDTCSTLTGDRVAQGSTLRTIENEDIPHDILNTTKAVSHATLMTK